MEVGPRYDGTIGETDPIILVRRQRQIDFGKNNEDYKTYLSYIPRESRYNGCPRTPDKYRKISRRGFDGLVRNWKIKIHRWSDAIKVVNRFKAVNNGGDYAFFASKEGILSDLITCRTCGKRKLLQNIASNDTFKNPIETACTEQKSTSILPGTSNVIANVSISAIALESIPSDNDQLTVTTGNIKFKAN